MAWTTPKTWTVGEIVTKAMLDEQIKANEDYLKAETDKLDDITVAEPTRAIDGTVYQNSTKIRFVSITILSNIPINSTNANAFIEILSDVSTPPTTVRGDLGFASVTTPATVTEQAYFTISFMVLPNHYYKVTSTTSGSATVGKVEWHEWDLH